jgi:ribosomal protein S18 acetylase RimI-like enzyme
MQSGGTGKRLLKAAEEYAMEQDSNVIEITVITVRTELINWYERHGYTKTGETKPFPVDTRFGIPKQPLHFYVMEKRLEGLNNDAKVIAEHRTKSTSE